MVVSVIRVVGGGEEVIFALVREEEGVQSVFVGCEV